MCPREGVTIGREAQTRVAAEQGLERHAGFESG